MRKDLRKLIKKCLKEVRKPLQHYGEDYKLFSLFNNLSIFTLFVAFLVSVFSPNTLIRAVSFSYLFFGAISDLMTNFIIGNIWSRQSLQDNDVVDPELLPKLREVSWLPRIVGILERIIFTAGFIIPRYEFIGAWLVLKVVGSWKDNSYEKKGGLQFSFGESERIFF